MKYLNEKKSTCNVMKSRKGMRFDQGQFNVSHYYNILILEIGRVETKFAALVIIILIIMFITL